MIRLVLLLLLASCATTSTIPRQVSTVRLTNWAWDVVRVDIICTSNDKRLLSMRLLDKGTKVTRRFTVGTCQQVVPVAYYRGRRDRPVKMTRHWIAVQSGHTICITIAELITTSTVVDCTMVADTQTNSGSLMGA